MASEAANEGASDGPSEGGASEGASEAEVAIEGASAAERASDGASKAGGGRMFEAAKSLMQGSAMITELEDYAARGVAPIAQMSYHVPYYLLDCGGNNYG